VSLYRLYSSDELGKDGYPAEWHSTIKHDVRADAGQRCARCKHPYRNGKHGTGEWSTCDDECRHGGPVKYWTPTGGWGEYDGSDETIATHVEARWRILTVHHLDMDKANCRWWNLAALCQRCHLQIQGKVQMERVWVWEHSDWFKPYVAGFYAWSYLGEDLTRDEVEGRLDELLELERVA